MRIILMSNLSYSNRQAEAFYQSGVLHKYITSNMLTQEDNIPSFIPDFYKEKISSRFVLLPKEIIFKNKLPEYLQYSMFKSNLFSKNFVNWIHDNLFDIFASFCVEPCDVFEFVHSIGLFCAKKAKRLGAKVVCTVRQEIPSYQERVIREEYAKLNISLKQHSLSFLLENRMLSELLVCDKVICASEYVKKTYAAYGVHPSKMAVVPYGISEQLHDLNVYNQKKDDFIVMFVGQVCVRKGVHYLLQVFDELNINDASLLIVGRIDSDFKDIIKRYDGKFKWIENASKRQLAYLYSKASVLVLPALADAFGLVVTEAMQYACTVIVSENTGASELITDGHDGFIVHTGDIAMLKEKILFLSNNREACFNMGIAAKQTISRCTWQKHVSELLNIYSLLGHTV